MSIARRDAVGGVLAGLALIGVMELAGALGVRTLPDIVQDRLLAATPGAVFGFLIDTLQHAGKVLEEVGLLVAILVVATLIALAAAAARRRGLPLAGLVAGAVVWLLVCLVVYPLTGRGVLGLAGAGWMAPVAWLVAAGVYALLLEAGDRPTTADGEGRRRLLWWSGALGLAAVAVTRAPGWLQYATSLPSSVGKRTPAVTPVSDFYLVSKNFQDPTVAVKGWSLHVGGMVESSLRLDYARLEALPSVTRTVTLECISNPVGGNLMSTGHFTGVQLRELLGRVRPTAGAGALSFRAHDGYTESMDLPLAMSDPDILVAYKLDGRPLPDQHGFPARLIIPGRYGMRGPKWIEEISLVRSEDGGYWESQGWEPHVEVATTSRIDVPAPDATLHHGTPVELAGVAFAGIRGIKEVQWSMDGGTTWHPARLTPPLSPLTWVLWTAQWTPTRSGNATLAVRAKDGSGAWQTSTVNDSFPRGATGYHLVPVSVS